MNAETLASGRLAAMLADTAAGMLADTAAAGLIIAHGHFLHDPDVFVATSWRSGAVTCPACLLAPRSNNICARPVAE